MQGIPAIAEHPWAYPALEVVHILGIALLLGNLVLLELRVWGAAADLPMRSLARPTIALSSIGFGLVALSGLTMFAANPAELLANRLFVIKLGLISLAGCNAAWFHGRGGLDRADALARAQTVVSLVLWIAALACGRFLAYV